MDLISRQAAINAIENTDCELSSDVWDELTDAIMQLPTIEPKKVVEDYCIPRNLMVVAAEDFHRLSEQKPSHDWNGWENGCGRTYDTMYDTESWKTTATDTPIVEYAPVKKGKWIYHEPLDVFGCSVCGRQMVRNIFDYCPWCGARMERSEGGET